MAVYWRLLQLSFICMPHDPASLLELRQGERGVLDRLELPEDAARRLMELGFLPGAVVLAAGSAPGGDPRVFRVEGVEIALRRETAACLKLRQASPAGAERVA